ncbi:type ISP restriction/modification enzyme [Megasphaera sp.]|uniref:DEAD/DEAH box helicase n=1 Tax=Megasphaera sp. TaxID=2023260 RepID=UPI00257F4C9F|nr:type ISP restriction/modification enzyme [Megasphaera sp.]
MMDFTTILERYQKYSFSERDKGTRFEELMGRFLVTNPLYADDLDQVWLWTEFPFRNDFGGKDIGIDLVAKTKSGDYWAIQCKCYAPSTTISKADVDTFLSTSGKYFTDEMGQQRHFTRRLWIATTDRWSKEANITLKNQEPPVNRLGPYDLRTAPVDWQKLYDGETGSKALAEKKTPRPHQKEAIAKAHAYYKNHDRGKMISACGTGKTYTALKIVEDQTHKDGFALFLVPSIALLSQTLREWMNDTTGRIYPICICSDASSSRMSQSDREEMSTLDLPFPATTNVEKAVSQLRIRFQQQKKHGGMVIIFSTYQSIDVVHAIQDRLLHPISSMPLTDGQLLLPLTRVADSAGLASSSSQTGIFDIIVCDEAHRTTGTTLAGKEESSFVKVHNNDFLKARHRLYMTATPRLYTETAKSKAKQESAVLCSMDDESLYGEEFYRLGFGEAVNKGLLSDYKVLVLTIGEDMIPPALQDAVSSNSTEINTDAAAKLIGCINALSKRMIGDSDHLKDIDPGFMHTALAFCSSIRNSQRITGVFNNYAQEYYDSLTASQREEMVHVSAMHVDGSMNAMTRQEKLDWLQSSIDQEEDCHILTNVRCLSEGIDVPALDAIIFLSARNSQVDVVQSVGRVMRKPKNGKKKYGYIIIPVVVPANVEPEKALDESKDFGTIWTVLNALRAHDDRFNATINKIELNKNKPEQILVSTIPPDDDEGGDGISTATAPYQTTLYFSELQGAIYARMVKRVGSKRYWEQWASDIAKIAERHKERIIRLIDTDSKHRQAFDNFMKGLHTNINPNIKEEEAIEMLAQHMITKPVFEALFENYSFVNNNTVSQSMQRILALLDNDGMAKDQEQLERFYQSVRERCEGVDNAEGKQKIIIELYDKFFKTALPKTVEKLGIVYTPVEVVDFILNSVNDVLKKEFNRSLSDENVHILDPFVGTGTFITRLLQSDIIKPKDRIRKYTRELHANEIVLLAYYIASINIENAFHDLMQDDGYTSFDGICLTDTFQLGEENSDDRLFSEVFPKNSIRVLEQKHTPIRVIVGNPPYSVGQKSANDDAQNESYPHLESRIAATYAKNTKATNKNALYDSYIKAFRWASDRIDPDNGGVIGFVSNAGWLDGAAMDGMRYCLEREFSSIYVFNLRGNARTSGEVRRKERDNVFGQGSRTPVAITILVKNPKQKKEKANIYYHDIGDYLSREEKLSAIADFKSCMSSKFPVTVLKPNEYNDWLNQRNGMFEELLPLTPKKKFDVQSKSLFVVNSRGLETGRDAWIFNYSKIKEAQNIEKMIEFYNAERLRYANQSSVKVNFQEFINKDPKKISWTTSLLQELKHNIIIQYENNNLKEALYRPFQLQALYHGDEVIHRRGQMRDFFPTESTNNVIINLTGIGSKKNFSVIISQYITCLDAVEKGQCFPLYYYEEHATAMDNLFGVAGEKEYIRHDGVTDFALKQARELYGPKVTKEDIFYYVYGFLHLPSYREEFAADLKKSLPRILFVEEPKQFWQIEKAGRQLADVHLNYENQPVPDGVVVEGAESGNFTVKKLKFKSKKDKSILIYNDDIRITHIPLAVYDYVVNGRSPVEWIMDRYQVSTHKESGITNDPNDWAIEHGKPRYILDLLLSVMTVSLKTQEIVNSLPEIKFE